MRTTSAYLSSQLDFQCTMRFELWNLLPSPSPFWFNLNISVSIVDHRAEFGRGFEPNVHDVLHPQHRLPEGGKVADDAIGSTSRRQQHENQSNNEDNAGRYIASC